MPALGAPAMLPLYRNRSTCGALKMCLAAASCTFVLVRAVLSPANFATASCAHFLPRSSPPSHIVRPHQPRLHPMADGGVLVAADGAPSPEIEDSVLAQLRASNAELRQQLSSLAGTVAARDAELAKLRARMAVLVRCVAEQDRVLATLRQVAGLAEPDPADGGAGAPAAEALSSAIAHISGSGSGSSVGTPTRAGAGANAETGGAGGGGGATVSAAAASLLRSHLEALNFTGADDEQDMDSYAIHGEFTSLLEVLLQKFAEAHAMSETDFEREVEAARKAGRERIATADDGDAAASSSAGVPLTVYRLLDLGAYLLF